MPRWVKAIAMGLFLCMILSLCGFSGDCTDLRDRVVRVHILAHSDSAEDQQLKLQVRDAVVKSSAALFEGITTADEAMAAAKTHLPDLQRVAQETVAAAGYDYPVTAELTNMYFSTRDYDDGRFPAGVYRALRIVIGDGKGKNWWCVAFPPICLGSATDHTADLSDVLTDGQQEMVEHANRYAVRFKVVEWFESLVDTVGGWW